MDLKALREICEKATEGPWEWHIEDYSMASLWGKRGLEDGVMAVSPCGSCQPRAKKDGKWKWGRCQTPKESDAAFIAAARSAMPKLLEIAEKAEKMRDGLVIYKGEHPYDLWKGLDAALNALT